MYKKDAPILLVDDSDTAREYMRNLFNELGFTNLLEAPDGAVGFEKLKANLEFGIPIELVVSDWNMPVLNGLDFLQKVRASQEFSHLGFLMITAEGETSQVVRAAKAGASGYIIKPFTGETLKQKIISVWTKHNKI